MLQRVQTIFLFLVALSMALMLFFRIWDKGSLEKDIGEQAIITAFEQVYTRIDTVGTDNEAMIEEKKMTFPIAILAILAIGVAGFSIFKYDNRLTQMKLGALNALLIAGALGLSLYYTLEADKLLLPGTPGNYRLGFFMPVAALMFNLLSNRFIRRDEKLVRSVDRLR